MGDVLRRNPDGTLDYVDRVKYMITSGGENIYPAEVELILLKDERVETAVVVRKSDARWGEVPVAFVVKRDEVQSSDHTPSAEELLTHCRGHLAGYKVPKELHFITDDDIPRSTTGKIQRHLLESRIN